MAISPNPLTADALSRLSRRHLSIGWTGLLIFLVLGIALETLHGFKTGYYLDTRNTTRRLMWTLAHSHGTLFSLINIAFALSLNHFNALDRSRSRLASNGLIGALALMPLGFFLGGLKLYGGDPGPGILFVPLGAVLLLAGVGAFALEILRNRNSPGTPGAIERTRTIGSPEGAPSIKNPASGPGSKSKK